MSVKEQDTGIPLGQNSSKVAGGEKDRSKITIALTYFSENKKSGISYGCLYNHATNITPSGNYHNGTVNGKSRRENTPKRNISYLATGNKNASAQWIQITFYTASNPRVKKWFFLNSRLRNSYFPSCHKKQHTFFQVHWDSVLLWFLPFCLAKIPQTHPQH